MDKHPKQEDSYEFSIVIPTFNRRDVLIQSMNALATARAPWPCELVVVDDGSTDGSAQAARELAMPLPTRVISQQNSGAAAARNRGASEARGEFLLFLDDDMAADAELLVEHSRALRAGADAVVGQIPLHPDTPPSLLTSGLQTWVTEREQRLSKTNGQLTLGDLLTGQLSVRAELFAGIDGFDTRFTAGGTFGAEDTDFLYRLLRSGAQVRFAAGAISYQRYVVTPEQNLKQWRLAGRADTILVRKHPELANQLIRQHRGRTAMGLTIRAATGRLPAVVEHSAGQAVLTRVAAGRTDRPTRWAFSQLRDAHYWKGAREQGGLTAESADGRSVRVLAYHAVADVDHPAPSRYLVPPRLLEQQLSALSAAGFHFISATELLDGLAGRRLPPRAILVTFDDGYVSVHHTARHILARLAIPAVAFVVTGLVGRWNEWDARAPVPKLPLMDRAQLAELVAQGWELGTHTRTHPHLRGVSASQLADEVAGSRKDLAELGLGTPRLLAYPYGQHSSRVRAAAERAGYDAAFAVGRANNGLDAGSRFDLLRMEVAGDLSAAALVRLALRPPPRRWRSAKTWPGRS